MSDLIDIKSYFIIFVVFICDVCIRNITIRNIHYNRPQTIFLLYYIVPLHKTYIAFIPPKSFNIIKYFTWREIRFIFICKHKRSCMTLATV